MSASCGTTARPDPFAGLGDPAPGTGRIVVVCASRGIGGLVGTSSNPDSFMPLHPGGSLKFELPPGRHELTVQLRGPSFNPSHLSEWVHLQEGETRWFSLDVSGPLESARMDSAAGYGTDLLPMRSPGPIQVRLVPVSATKAARIAVY